MERVYSKLRTWDDQFVSFLKPKTFTLLRISIGLIYVLFGGLKFLPNYSPAEQLAIETIELMTFGIVSGATALFLLAILEVGIGIGLIIGKRLKVMILFTLCHMACTFLPMILLPDSSYTDTPISLSLVGQYILKNIIIISALLMLYTSHQKATD